MIIKGRSRGAARQLAAYLLSAKNEKVTVLDVRGTAQSHLKGALQEMEAVGLSVTQSRKVLYHAQIAPSRHDNLTGSQFLELADRLEKRLGLAGQPRVIVEHQYEGHQHLHVVWGRADTEKGQVISDSWDRREHHLLCRQVEKEWGLQQVQSSYQAGARRGNPTQRDRECRQNTRIREEAKEIGEVAREKELVRSEIAWCWGNSQSGQALCKNLREMGYSVAEGRAGPIALDQQTGATYSLARYAGVRREEVRQRLRDAGQLSRHEEQSQNRKAGHGSHLSRRKAQRVLRDDLAHQVANDTGSHAHNQRQAERLDRLRKAKATAESPEVPSPSPDHLPEL